MIAIRQTALTKLAQSFPKAFVYINRHFYVDAGFSGADSVEQGIIILFDARTVLPNFNIVLQKIVPSNASSTKAFSQSEIAEPNSEGKLACCEFQCAKGILWNLNTDTQRLHSALLDQYMIP